MKTEMKNKVINKSEGKQFVLENINYRYFRSL